MCKSQLQLSCVQTTQLTTYRCLLFFIREMDNIPSDQGAVGNDTAALFTSIYCSIIDIAAQIGSVQLANLFVNSDRLTPAQLLTPNEDGETPVYIAARMGNVEVVNLFVNCDKFTPAQQLTPNKNGETPVYVARRLNMWEVVNVFVYSNRFTPDELRLAQVIRPL